jgi:hypothetical protein
MPRKKKAAQAAPLIQQIKKAQQQMAQQMAQQIKQQAQQIKQQAKAQQIVQQLVQKAKQQSVEAPASTTASTKKRAKAGGVTGAMRVRAKAIVDAISEGHLPVKQGVTKPTEAPGKTPSARYQKFLSIYKSARPSKPKAVRAKSVRTVYQQIPGQQKFPYYLVPGYTSRVGGGASGPGVIRAVPKSGATSFRSLDESKQREIVRFLNTEAGKALRGKGAKRQVVFQQIEVVIRPERQTYKQFEAAQAAKKTKRAQVARKAAQTRKAKKIA